MIDITVVPHENMVSIENNDYIIPQEIVPFIRDLLDKLKYSGERISLWRVMESDNKKHLVKEWP